MSWKDARYPMRLMKRLWQGFAGGPDFSRLQKLTFQLEEFQLDVTLPYSNIAATEPPPQLNIPFRSDGWFQQHAKQQMHNHQVLIHTEGWCYLAPIQRGENSEYGVLWLQLALQKTPEGVNALNRQHWQAMSLPLTKLITTPIPLDRTVIVTVLAGIPANGFG